MLEHIIYINHKNEKIEFGKNGVFVKDSDLLDYEWSVKQENNVIQNFNKNLKNKSFTVAIKGNTSEDSIAKKNRIFEVFETDVLSEKSGKMVIGEYYLQCYVIESKKSDFVKKSNYIVIKFKIIPEYPYWCHELEKTFPKGIKCQEAIKTGKLSYPYRYPYHYPAPQDASFIENDHYAACDFKLFVYGPCTNPAIRINGHLYEVTGNVYAGEYIEVDSRNNTVYHILNDGTKKNIYNWRNKESSLFEKIPAGRCNVSWNRESFGFDIVLFQERSEPKWSL